MKGLRSGLRLFSYFFNAMVSLLALINGVILLSSGPVSVNYPLLPLSRTRLGYTLIALALVGAVILMAAVRRKIPLVYLVWTLLVLAVVVRFFFFSTYGYTEGSSDFRYALLAVLAAAVAALGAGRKFAANSR